MVDKEVMLKIVNFITNQLRDLSVYIYNYRVQYDETINPPDRTDEIIIIHIQLYKGNPEYHITLRFNESEINIEMLLFSIFRPYFTDLYKKLTEFYKSILRESLIDKILEK